MSETITWYEAIATQELLGMNDADFARLVGTTAAAIQAGKKNPGRLLNKTSAALLYLAVNNKSVPGQQNPS